MTPQNLNPSEQKSDTARPKQRITPRALLEAKRLSTPRLHPDGQRVAFSSDRSGLFRTFITAASGVGGLDSVATMANGPSGPTSWSRDGANLLAIYLAGANQWDVWRIPIKPGEAPTPFVSTPFIDNFGVYSPDGRWIAYQSNQSGRFEIYVQAADGSGGKWQISGAGGTKPRWRGDGRELFFEAPGQMLTAVPVTGGASFEIGTPIPLFRASLVTSGYSGTRWEVASDGQRLLVNAAMRGPDRATFVVVTNWASELRRK
jgi:Tol biopolymer transport system component